MTKTIPSTEIRDIANWVHGSHVSLTDWITQLQEVEGFMGDVYRWSTEHPSGTDDPDAIEELAVLSAEIGMRLLSVAMTAREGAAMERDKSVAMYERAILAGLDLNAVDPDLVATLAQVSEVVATCVEASVPDSVPTWMEGT